MENKEKINSISSYLKEIFGIKTVKLSIDGGFTCPNRDGKAGFGGCSFCSASGSGDMASNLDNIHEQIVLLEDKWPKVSKFLAYFQSHTSTYAPVTELKVKYEKALSHEKIAGLVIATRPDCLPEDVLDLLSELNKKTFLWVELGLQTIHEVTAEATNRGYPLQMYAQAVKHLDERKIKYVTHLILGLPGETKEMMDASVKYVCGLSNEPSAPQKPPFGIKLHLMNLVKGSPLAEREPEFCSFETMDEYIDLVCHLLTFIPSSVTIHRLTGDVPRPMLISPSWSYKKRSILNGIHKKMKEENLFQGCKIIDYD